MPKKARCITNGNPKPADLDKLISGEFNSIAMVFSVCSQFPSSWSTLSICVYSFKLPCNVKVSGNALQKCHPLYNKTASADSPTPFAMTSRCNESPFM